MTTNTTTIENMKRTIRLMSRALDNMTGSDHEEQDVLRRALRDLSCDVDALELDQQPACGEELADSLAA